MGSFTQPIATTMASAIPYAPVSSPSPALGSISFKLTSAVGGANLPFCFGHAFREGDVPSGLVAVGTGPSLLDWQCTPLTYWPDGSLKHAIIAGHVTAPANTASTVTFTTGAAPGGTSLTESDLAAALGTTTVSVSVGSQTVSLGTLVSASLAGSTPAQRMVCTGPVMSNWIYMQVVPGYPWLSVWFDVRLYGGNGVEIFPWVENGWLDPGGALTAQVGADTDYNLSCSVTIGAGAAFPAQSLDLCANTRIPLVTGDATQCSYWVNVANPGWLPQHDTAYLMATKLVPNYPFGAAAVTQTFAQTYTPNSLADVTGAMASTGYETFIGILPEWCAIHLAGGAGATAYNSVIVNGLAGGSWPVHYRDNTIPPPATQARYDVPTFIAYPTVSTNWSGSPTIPSSTGKVNVDSQGNVAAPDTAHSPSLAYYPWLLTARWFFLEELLLWNFWNYLMSDYATRNGTTSTGASYVQFDGQIRARGWNFRTLAQCLSAVPTTHASYPSLLDSWAANMASYRAAYVDGTIFSGKWKNNLGCFGLYSGNATNSSLYGLNPGTMTYWWGAPWMQATIAMSLGYAWDLGLPLTAAQQADHIAVRDFGYSQFVQRAGPPNTPGAWDYRNFSQYAVPFSYPGTATPGTWFSSWGQAYPVYEEYGGLFSVLPALQPGDTTMYYGSGPLAWDGSSWTGSSATCFQMVALTYAVDHGATGAATGWKQIVTSASFGNATSTVNGYPTNPLWAIYPRNPPP